MKETMVRTYPIHCPICDEDAWPTKSRKRIIEVDCIYTHRTCENNHSFYSIEYIPKDQDTIVEYLKKRSGGRMWTKISHENLFGG